MAFVSSESLFGEQWFCSRSYCSLVDPTVVYLIAVSISDMNTEQGLAARVDNIARIYNK